MSISPTRPGAYLKQAVLTHAKYVQNQASTAKVAAAKRRKLQISYDGKKRER
jgi:hypothetical protein